MRVRIHQGTKEIGGTRIEVDLQRFAKALAPEGRWRMVGRT